MKFGKKKEFVLNLQCPKKLIFFFGEINIEKTNTYYPKFYKVLGLPAWNLVQFMIVIWSSNPKKMVVVALSSQKSETDMYLSFSGYTPTKFLVST